MTKELKPCPFCGNINIKIEQRVNKQELPPYAGSVFDDRYTHTVEFYVERSPCGFKISAHNKDVVAAINSLTSRWNKRIENQTS